MNITLPKLVKSMNGLKVNARTTTQKNNKGQMQDFIDYSIKTPNFELIMRNPVSYTGNRSKRNFVCQSSSNMQAYIRMPHSNALVIKGSKHTKLVQGDNSFVRLSPGVSNYIATNTNMFPSFDSGVHMIDDKNIEDANPMFPEQIKKAHNAVMNAKKKQNAKKTAPVKESTDKKKGKSKK